MSTPLKVTLSEKARKVLADLQALPQWALVAIADGMKKSNQLTIAHIQAKHLTGVGPFPVSEHRLGIKTNNLRVQAHATDPVIAGTTVTSSIGDPVKYAGLHEFGGVIHFAARQRSLRFKTKASPTGRVPKTQGKNGHLWIFAKRNDKQVHEMTAQSKAYDVHMPERAPFRTGIAERMEATGRTISRALVTAWKGQAAT